MPINVVDHPELSDFHTPAIIDRGQVVAAIGTAGAAPIVAALVRAELEAKLPAGSGGLAGLFGGCAPRCAPPSPTWPSAARFCATMMGGPVAEAADAGDLATAERLMRAALAEGAATPGVVWLIADARRRAT